MPAILAADPRATVAAIVVLMVFGLLGIASVVVVARAAERRRRGDPVVPWSWRRPVPWGAGEVVLVLALYFFLPGYVWLPLVARAFDVPIDAPQPAERHASLAQDVHPIGRLLAETTNPWLLLLAALTAVVVAPVVEEFLFRMVVQGWLESIEWRQRLHRRFALPPGALPIAASSLLFAMLHVRPAGVEIPLETIALRLGAQAATGVSVIVLGPLILRHLAGAGPADLGWATRKLGEDVRLGLWGWLGATAPVYLVFALAKTVAPDGLSADPAPLFPLAIVLGTMYYRTHRIAGPIVLHAAFNFTGLVLAVLNNWGGGAP